MWNITAPSTTSARMFSSVCETSVPSTIGKRSRTRPTRLATISAREGSPSRAGSVADISTPIIVARAVSRRRTRVPGRAARRIACQASARTSIEAHMSAKATSTQTGVAATIARPIDSMPSRCSASAARPAPATAPPRPARGARSRATRRRPAAGAFGSSDGSRCGPTRGPGSDGTAPVRCATRATRPSGSGAPSASS